MIVSSSLFARVAMAQSSDPGRSYINGVRIEPHRTLPGVIMIATDGHQLLVAYDADATPPATAVTIALGKDGLKAATKGQTLTVDLDTGTARVDDLWTSPATTVNEGGYPDWRRVLPSGDLTQTPAAFDPALLLNLRKALTPGVKTGGLVLRGADAASAHLATAPGNRTMFGVVMPIRADAGETLPDWVAAS